MVFVHVAGWTPQDHPPSNPMQSLCSFSNPTPKPTKPTEPTPNLGSKSISTSALPTMTTASTASRDLSPRNRAPYDNEAENMTTLPDPRNHGLSPTHGHTPSSSPHHPDLSNEVATLSNKLINAINHQTNLDDTLSATRHELDASRERIRQLERENQEHYDQVTQGILVRRTIADAETTRLVSQLAEEKRQREHIEKEKKNIEQELENLTTALFEEANKMVITAREEALKEHDAIQRRNDQLRTQLADTESLLKSHQEQLAELKQVMEQMTEVREDQVNPTAPSTPRVSNIDASDKSNQDGDAHQATFPPEPAIPTYPTSFTHLLHTVLRTDLTAYDEFTSLLKISKNIISNRASSGSYGSGGLGVGLGSYNLGIAQQPPANSSTPTLPTTGTFSSSPTTPTTPGSSISIGSTTGPSSVALKDTRFYKRALAEDIEPTLRLDAAPGLSWLARRTVLNAMCEGTLVVEPKPGPVRPHPLACSLCGEARNDPAHSRGHRFRTSENENAQRYPLCEYCLGRVRSTCDFLGFLRVLKDGHWRGEGQGSEKAAWEESVRLREQMFWRRIGGGVVPVPYYVNGNPPLKPHVDREEDREQPHTPSDKSVERGEVQPRDATGAEERPPAAPRESLEDNGHAPAQDCVDERPRPATRGGSAVPTDATVEADMAYDEKDATNRISIQSTPPLQTVTSEEGGKDGAKRLSITIPKPLE